MNLRTNPDLRDSRHLSNSCSARSGGDSSTINYVWDTNNNNVRFQ